MARLFFFYSLVCFFFLSQSLCSSSVHHICSPSEAFALLQFKQSLQISDNPTCLVFQAITSKIMSWNESRDCCTWDGVSCDLLTGHVIGLDLSCSHLEGIIHPNSSLFQLYHLQTLNLAYNNFNYSSIPNDIGHLRNLRHLDLSESFFSGKIPTEISYLSNLVSLDLSFILSKVQLDQKTFETLLQNFTKLEVVSLPYVNISSPLPMNLSSSLRYVNLKDTNLQGVLTESFFILPNLERLKLCDNHFTGKIPNVFSNLQELVELDLSNNSFVGPFPSSILSLRNLQRLDLSSNSLSGPLPSNTSMLQKLADLNLSDNLLNGTIPSWVFSITQELNLHHNRFSRVADELKINPTLESLFLSHNQLSGPFPQSLANLTNLEILVMSSNNISDNAGIEVLVTMQRLYYIDLSYNSVSWRTNINVSKITFPSLTYFILSSCELTDFPHFLRNSKYLQILDLSNNFIHGPVPNWLSGMTWDSLTHLNLSHNSLTGHIEQLLYPNLKLLDLKFNFLQGQLPSSICKLNHLMLLDLSHNNFSESVPHCFRSMNWLEVLDLRMNNFSGSLPPFCTQSTSLTTIVLNGNRFEGPVPVSLLNCSGLEVLDMGKNAITDTFPAWLGTLEWLKVLILKSNKFHGPISNWQNKSYFPRMKIFDLSHNEFSGSMPAEVFLNFKAMIRNDTDKGEITYMKELFKESSAVYKYSVRLVIKGHDIELEKISTIMTTIDLSSNHFEGVIPKTLKDLSSLWLLNLSHNNLRGDIPLELGQLNMLEALDLSWNRLTGKIPRELTRIKFLAVLNLSQNLLVGPIPHGQQFNTFETDSYGGNLDLCGFPLSKQCGTSDPSHVPQPLESEEEEDESYFLSGFTWESVVIGYSCGLLVGFVMWNLMFKTRKPKWLVEFLEGAFPKKMRMAQKRRLRRQK
ncbi:hypothetical protein K7X08_015513 [Anisodus acutangulus]|uniref:Leucine-rich repeat-containing N-terminal plant-type domain-containing protein n=1 Tax=Anisodus acutangulus TaxID=402998 RepID=A0A9Q1QVL4_9SOLA|nr:hypothetical protein K7X08_015513 [Anisodus acutangulus]